jgi:hypothetical protein
MSVFKLALVVSCCLALCQTGYSQSTFGAVLGTVKDPSGSLIPAAKVNLLNTGTNANRSSLTNTLTEPMSSSTWMSETTSSRWKRRVSNYGVRAVRVSRQSHLAYRRPDEGCFAGYRGDRGGGLRRANGCLQRRRDEREPGVDRPSRGDRHPRERFHQRLLDARRSRVCSSTTPTTSR